MKTIEEINEIAPYHPLEWQQGYGIWQAGYMEGQKNGATEQKAIDEANPSDAVIMRILNAIGYEEESWIPIVRKNLETREE